MILQLNPMIPIKRISDQMEGYAFLVIDYSQDTIYYLHALWIMGRYGL